MGINTEFIYSLRFRILAPLLVAFSCVMLISLSVIYWQMQTEIQHEVAEHTTFLQQLLPRKFEEYAEAMAAALETMEYNRELRSALDRKDRAVLLAQTHELFEKLRAKHLITHFYFTDPQRINILRVHAPQRFGDSIDRSTTLKAETSGRLSWGLELGHFGVFTLRVVAPWREDGRLLGFVELGAEIEHLVRRLEQTMDSHLLLAVNKRYLQKAQWQAGQQQFGLTDSWDLNPDWVLSGHETLPVFPQEWPELESIINSPAGEGPDAVADYKHYRWSRLPLEDVEGRPIGFFLLLQDVTQVKQQGWRNLLWVTMGSLLVGGMVVLMLYLISRKTDWQLETFHGELLRVHDELENRVKERTRELSQSEEKYRDLVENANSIILRWDPQGRVTFLNEYAQKLFGFSEQEILGRHVMGTIVPETEEHTGRDLTGMIADIGQHPERYINNENENMRKDGSRLWITWNNRAIHDEQGRVCEILSLGQDITERKRDEARIHFMAYYDELTGLPNRTLFKDRLQHALQHAKRNQQQMGLIYMDLDQFKAVNDTLGHAMGDRLLNQAARRLCDCVREEDTVARMGGDEFTVIIENLKSWDAVEIITRIADKLKRRMQESFEIDGNEMFVTASMGIVRYPVDGESVEELTKNADTAMYYGKANGRNNYQLFEADMMVEAKHRQQLEVKLRQALERGELYLRYQPLIDMQTDQVLGVEALLGWSNSELGYVPPAEFISVAETMGLIEVMGEWVLETACRQFMAWRENAIGIPRLAINLSPRQIRQAGFVPRVAAILQQTGMDPEALVMEITENVLISDPQHAIAVLYELRRLGIKLAMDDFGTGYSSLSHLKQLPIDIVKIDRSFIMDTPQDEDDVEIVTAIIAMAQRLNLLVVAEGIETPEQRQFLQQLECHTGQGYLFSYPLVAVKLQAWMEERQDSSNVTA